MASQETSLFQELVDTAQSRSAINSERPIHTGRATLPGFLRNSEQFVRSKATDANIGLWWERYGYSFAMLEKKVPTAKVDKGGWVKQICALNDKQQAQSGRLKGNAEKIRDMVERAEVPGLCFDLTLTTRLVIGMGVPHPIENGTNFHPTLGVPYVPGSALKGATQAFADEWLRNGDYDGVERAEFNTVMRRVFGQPERLKSSASHAEGKTSVGSVAFLDAVPCEPLKLIPEIMTSHMGTYLDAPEGFNLESAEPKPICFLAVEKGTKFRFSIMPTRSSVLNYGIDEAKSDLHIAGGWLVACLRDIGIGAKTKSGYGRFDVAPT